MDNFTPIIHHPSMGSSTSQLPDCCKNRGQADICSGAHFQFSLGMYPGVELLGHLVTVPTFRGSPTVSYSCYTVLHPHQPCTRVLQFLHILASTCHFAFLFYYNHQREGEWYLMVAQICILSSICSCPCWLSTYLL